MLKIVSVKVVLCEALVDGDLRRFMSPNLSAAIPQMEMQVSKEAHVRILYINGR